MISFDNFTKSLESGEIKKLNFTYESKEYLIVREEGEARRFVFASEDAKAVRFPTARELAKTVTVGGCPLRDVWNFIVPICNDTLLDDDFIQTTYADTLGKIMCSASGTTASHERYLTQYFLPSVIFVFIVLFAFFLCALCATSITWTIFGIVAGSVMGAFAVAQVVFVSDTKKYRHGNPRAHCYLLSRGAVIVTDRFEYAIPYEKILRLDTEAGIQIVTLKTVFSFTPNHGEELTESLKTIYEEVRAIKKVFRRRGSSKV